MSKEERDEKEAKIDKLIADLHKKFSKTITDPVALSIIVAKVYAKSVLLTYKQSNNLKIVKNG